MTVVLSLMVLVIVSIAWNGYKKFQLRKFQLKFSHLNEELEELVAAHKLKRDSFLYNHMRAMSVKAYNNLQDIHLWSLLALAIMHRNNPQIKETHKNLSDELAKNQEAKKLYEKTMNTFNEYIICKHVFLLIIFALGIISLVKSAKAWKKCRMALFESIEDFPENSSSYTLLIN